MLCYGQGSLATMAYAPSCIRWLGAAMLLVGALTLGLGPAWAIPMMGLTFGLGHISVGTVLLLAERRKRLPGCIASSLDALHLKRRHACVPKRTRA